MLRCILNLTLPFSRYFISLAGNFTISIAYFMIKENATAQDVTNFYDNFWKNKKLKKVNSRHRLIVKNLKKYGLNSNSKVLEVGCGNGILTQFIGKIVTNGLVKGVDISAETIEGLKVQFAGNKNLAFAVTDMHDYQDNETYDFIVFPDVLEHIPLEYHAGIFKSLPKITHKNSVIFINIPHPRATEYAKVHLPTHMQVIDLEVEADALCRHAYDNGFYLDTLESYRITYYENEYQRIIFRPNIARTTMTRLPKYRIVLRSLYLRIFG